MEKYYWLNEDSVTFLRRGYLQGTQSPKKRIKQICDNAENILKIKGFSEKFEDYMSRGFYSLSTPVWVNFGNERGLPVSCFNSHIEDRMDSILYKTAEVGMMSKMGGGTSGYFGELRPRGAKIAVGGQSSGPVHFMELFDKLSEVVSQGSARRGSFAAYLPIEHPDISEFLKIRDNEHPIQNMSFAITITDKWMKDMVEGNRTKRQLWASVIKKRFETGYPYIFFTDTVNRAAPKVYKQNKRKINASNLCSEICLSSDDEESFVCVLSSLNLLHWNEIKETDAAETMIYFLDAVNEEFIKKSRDVPFLAHAHNFAKNQRALGMGALGWHSLLQSKNIPFESMDAMYLNGEIWKTIQARANDASEKLAKKYGEPPMLKGHGKRNVTTLAIAPTTSSSFILGQISPSIEPLNSNYFVKDLAKGKFTYKNPYVSELLATHKKNNAKIWKSILTHGGSVQHLDFLSDEERAVFRTFGEISQKDIITQAAQRQKYIDQSQSLNLMIPPDTSAKKVNELMLFAWEQKIKTLYYQRSSNPAQQLSRDIMNCSSCEG